MIVEIEISPRALRMLKALSVLTGKSSGDISQEAGQLLESILASRIADELQVEPTRAALPRAEQRPSPAYSRDVTEVSNGLGDADIEPQEPTVIPPNDATPTKGALSDQDLEDDMKIDDPSTEAKGTFGEDLIAQQEEGSAEEVFGAIAGINAGPYENRWAERRKKRPTQSKGRVTPLMETAAE